MATFTTSSTFFSSYNCFPMVVYNKLRKNVNYLKKKHVTLLNKWLKDWNICMKNISFIEILNPKIYSWTKYAIY